MTEGAGLYADHGIAVETVREVDEALLATPGDQRQDVLLADTMDGQIVTNMLTATMGDDTSGMEFH